MAKVKLKKGGYVFFKELGGATKRAEVSRTAQILVDQKFVNGKVLDYGCGHGFDADHFGWESFDPYYRPGEPSGPFDTIIVNHVANILTRKSRVDLFDRVRELIAPSGSVYISVPRNIPEEGKHGPRKRLQNFVILDLPSIYLDDKMEIYRWSGGKPFKDRTSEFEER